MRLLTLVRHADASWDYPDLSDFERPLTGKGRRDAPRMALHAQQTLGRPDSIVSSPALRAIATARVFADALGVAEHAIAQQPRIYEASGISLLKLVQALDDRHDHVMLFGHNPGLSELAHQLAAGEFEDLAPAALIQIALDAARWGEVGAACGTVRHQANPKQLG